jgi:hypothetical protein
MIGGKFWCVIDKVPVHDKVTQEEIRQPHIEGGNQELVKIPMKKCRAYVPTSPHIHAQYASQIKIARATSSTHLIEITRILILTSGFVAQ